MTKEETEEKPQEEKKSRRPKGKTELIEDVSHAHLPVIDDVYRW